MPPSIDLYIGFGWTSTVSDLSALWMDGVQFLATAAAFSWCLSLRFICSHQYGKYWMPRGFPLTSSLLLDYHIMERYVGKVIVVPARTTICS